MCLLLPPPPSALHLAADAGQCDSVSRLVALGAPVDVASNKGLTPLALALMKVGGWAGSRQPARQTERGEGGEGA